MEILLFLLTFDTGRRAEPSVPVEKLGRAWIVKETDQDRGLPVTRYFNQGLSRDELWHQAPDGAWFLRVRENLYVLGVPAANGAWETRPTDRLVLRRGEWKRITTTGGRTRDR